MKSASYVIILISFLFQTAKTEAQTCTPYTIYTEDFGGDISSPEMGAALPSNVTSYKYSTTVPIEDGWYGIRKKVTGHPGTWQQLTTDHTGDGYMMVVNASYDAGKFYEKTITGLCQGSSFYFSVYVINLMKYGAGGDKDPNLRFVILNPDDRSVIAETTTGLLPRYTTPTWEKYGIDFDLPAGLSSVILQIFNNADGGNGNDLVLDDISFSICGPPMETSVSGMYQNGINTCIGNTVDLSASISNSTYHQAVYQWQFGTDTINWKNIEGANDLALNFPDITSEDSGWYRILAAEDGNIDREKCRISSHAIPVHVWKIPTAKITTNSPVCEGDELTLAVSHPSEQTVNWTGPNAFTSANETIQRPNAQTDFSGKYNVHIINPGGCEASGKADIIIQENDLSVTFDKTDTIICEGDQRILDAFSPGASYLWNTGATASKIAADSSGLYRVHLQKGVCALSDSIQLYSMKIPKVNLGADTSVCDGEPFYLHATYPDVENYLWGNGSEDSILTVTSPGTYSVTLSNYCGTARDNISIRMEPCSNELIFPTAFTPNADGQNDVFRPKVLIRLSDYDLKIFNRWGQVIFHSNDVFRGWNGTAHGYHSSVGTYTWIASYKRTKDGKDIRQKGVITLLR